MKVATIHDCKIINLQRIEFRAGNITPITNHKEIPFEIKRIFYIYDIPGGKDRGAHAHKECHQFLVATSGAFDVEVNDGKETRIFNLNQPYYGLHIPPGIWAHEFNFSSGAICLVLASHLFDENDYIREYDKYVKFIKNDTSYSNS
ncbi:WxcM-like domain-containing protein [archaeon]|nr:WxcM-like domain-containing protein [archaeon]